MAKKLPASIPRIALTPAEAAAAIGVGPDFFERTSRPSCGSSVGAESGWFRSLSWNGGRLRTQSERWGRDFESGRAARRANASADALPSRLRAMADRKEQGRRAAKKAQADYERTIDKARDSRRAGFEKAQKAGLSLREIGQAVGLHWTTVRQVLKGK